MIVVTGAQQAVDLAARVLLDSGDTAWVEDPGYQGARGALLAAGIRLAPIPVDTEGLDIRRGARDVPGARLAYVTPSHQYPLRVTMSLNRRLALRLPTMLDARDYVEAGGLMSYSPNCDDLYRRGAIYVDKILKGAQPADLPVEQATKFELVLNMRTAKALGLAIPQSLRLRADHVIE